MHRPGDLGRAQGRLAATPVDQPDGRCDDDAGGDAHQGADRRLVEDDPKKDPTENRDDEKAAAGLSGTGLHIAFMTAVLTLR